jgi:hypothetical protein
MVTVANSSDLSIECNETNSFRNTLFICKAGIDLKESTFIIFKLACLITGSVVLVFLLESKDNGTTIISLMILLVTFNY